MEPSRRSSFSRTRRAVRAGEPLHDWEARDLRADAFLGPRTFKAVELGFSITPTIVFLRLLEMTTEPSATSRPGDAILADNAADLLVLLVVVGLQVTILLQLPVLARGSLLPEDSTAEARRRTARVFLYHEGAHSLLFDAAAMGALGLPLWYLISAPVMGRTATLLFLGVVALSCLVVVVTHLLKPKARDAMLRCNGYSLDPGAPTTSAVLKRYGRAHNWSSLVLVVLGIVLGMLSGFGADLIAEPFQELKATVSGTETTT